MFFCSIIHWLLCTLFSHFISQKENPLILSTHVDGGFSGLYDAGEDRGGEGGGVWVR